MSRVTSIAATTRNRQRFVRLINIRMSKVLKFLHLIGNLSHRQNYEYTEDEAKLIVTRLREAVSEIEEKYKKGDNPNPRMHFRLSVND